LDRVRLFLQTAARLAIPANLPSEAIDAAIAPQQAQFNAMAKSSGVKANISDLQKNFQDVIDHYSGATPTSLQTHANPLQAELDSVMAKLPQKGGQVDLGALDKLRAEYDSATNFAKTQQNWQAMDQNRTVGNIIRKTIQDAANNSGLSNSITGGTLKQTGQELSKLYTMRNLADVRDIAAQGGKPIGLLKTLGLAAAGTGHIGGIAPTSRRYDREQPRYFRRPFTVSYFRRGKVSCSNIGSSKAPYLRGCSNHNSATSASNGLGPLPRVRHQ